MAAVPSIAAAPLPITPAPITNSRRVKPLSSSWFTNFHFGTQLHTTQFPVQRGRGRPPCLLNPFGVYSLCTEPVVTPGVADRNPSSHVRNVSYSTRCRMYLFNIVRNNQPAYRGTLLTDLIGSAVGPVRDTRPPMQHHRQNLSPADSLYRVSGRWAGSSELSS